MLTRHAKSPPPLVTATVAMKKPELVTHSAKPGAPLRSFEGLAGAVIGDLGYFVTSPNMDIVYSPSLQMSVIPVPSTLSDHELQLAWYRPTNDDFLAHDQNKPWTGMGIFAPQLRNRLQQFGQRLLDDVLQCSDNVKQDYYMRHGRDHIRKLLDLLDLPASRSESFLRLACLQRQCLELHARWKWLTVHTPHLHEVDHNFAVDRHVMGAFVDDLNAAHDLFRTGIPVWLIRHTRELATVRIDKLVNAIDESANHIIPLRDGSGFIDTQDESPEHPIVYQGLTHKAERYLAMARYICGLYSYSIFGNFASSSNASSSSSSPSSKQKSSTSLVDPVGRGLVSIHVPSSRKKPYSKPKSKQSTQQEERNKFLFHPNPFNPTIVPVWTGIKYSAATESGRKHEEMRQLLAGYVDETRSGIQLKLENLSSAPVAWRGKDFTGSEELSPTLVQEIVWEISEISFRLELMALDRYLLPHLDWEQRQSVLGDCWLGSPFHIDLSGTRSGLAEPNLNRRLSHLQSLFQVMKPWPGPKPILLDVVFPSRTQYTNVNDFEQAVVQVEEAIARFYVRTFLNTFKRPATIPRLRI
ncbi:hypothetical protein K435DRAFT_845547 [Dendrothele bispora CBS 962.96]|uniref:Uncharacterized protein n=1 Tax=Dendrothele bispora (strain CBS 962.96) TaxID=1314807 RepID=A0A4S8KTN8_DENBC|nr:hypothetical protein K435DRAFT_845547 [Dendrothele bispora CBS 962.96]